MSVVTLQELWSDKFVAGSLKKNAPLGAATVSAARRRKWYTTTYPDAVFFKKTSLAGNLESPVQRGTWDSYQKRFCNLGLKYFRERVVLTACVSKRPSQDLGGPVFLNMAKKSIMPISVTAPVPDALLTATATTLGTVPACFYLSQRIFKRCVCPISSIGEISWPVDHSSPDGISYVAGDISADQ